MAWLLPAGGGQQPGEDSKREREWEVGSEGRGAGEKEREEGGRECLSHCLEHRGCCPKGAPRSAVCQLTLLEDGGEEALVGASQALLLHNGAHSMKKALELALMRRLGQLVMDEASLDSVHGGHSHNGLCRARAHSAEKDLGGGDAAIWLLQGILQQLKGKEAGGHLGH